MAITAAEPARAESAHAVGRRGALIVAASLLLLTAAIHAAVIPEHIREWWPAAVFFVLVATGQATQAVSLLHRATTLTLLAAIWSTVAVVGTYVWSRTSGLPFAPVDHGDAHGAGRSLAGHAVGGHGNGVPTFPGTPVPTSAEPVAGPDLTALVAELAVIALLVFLLPERPRRWTGNGILGCGAVLIVLRGTGVLA
jgi:hypothetical protein